MSDCPGSSYPSAAVADIVRMVEAAQSRTAPVQRFADAVAVRGARGGVAALPQLTCASFFSASLVPVPCMGAPAEVVGPVACGAERCHLFCMLGQ